MARGAEPLDGGEEGRRRQPELRRDAGGLPPAAGPPGVEPGPEADEGEGTLPGLGERRQEPVHLEQLLQDHHHPEPDPRPEHREAQGPAVLVPVDDHQRSGGQPGPEGEGELGPGSRLEGDSVFPARPEQGLDDDPLLVDLERVGGAVGAPVGELVPGGGERVHQFADAGLEDLGEAEQEGGAGPLLPQPVDQGRQRDRPARFPGREHEELARRGHGEEAVSPARDAVPFQRFLVAHPGHGAPPSRGIVPDPAPGVDRPGRR